MKEEQEKGRKDGRKEKRKEGSKERKQGREKGRKVRLFCSQLEGRALMGFKSWLHDPKAADGIALPCQSGSGGKWMQVLNSLYFSQSLGPKSKESTFKVSLLI